MSGIECFREEGRIMWDQLGGKLSPSLLPRFCSVNIATASPRIEAFPGQISPGQSPSATETKHGGIAILSTQETISDDLGGDDAEGDAVSPVAERKVSMRKSRMHSEVSESVFCGGESAGPGESDLQFHLGNSRTNFFTSVRVFREISASRCFAFTKSSSSPPTMTRPSRVVRR